MESPGGEPPPPIQLGLAGQRWGRWLISVFVIWNVFATMLWLLPGSSGLARLGFAYLPVRPYMTLTGLLQGWGMFSPNPDSEEVYIEAVIRYGDGHRRSWVFPRLIRMGYGERYRRERLRKMVEVAHMNKNRFLWQSLASYAARVNNPDPQVPPESVILIRHFRIIPPPGQPKPPYRPIPMAVYLITPGDLQ